MTDPGAVSVATQQPPASDPPADQKSPLDILEEILGDAAKKGGAGAAAGAVPTSDAPNTPADPTMSADRQAQPPPPPQEPAMTIEEAEAIKQAHLEADQVALQQKVAELQTITQTPQYQARVEQNTAAATTSEEQTNSQAGFEIVQLEHKKIPDPQLAPVAPVEPVAVESTPAEVVPVEPVPPQPPPQT